jgi:hypothetical protein
MNVMVNVQAASKTLDERDHAGLSVLVSVGGFAQVRGQILHIDGEDLPLQGDVATDAVSCVFGSASRARR